MANVEKISVALTPDMVAKSRAAVEDGDYGSVSEVVREALRDWRLRRKIETLETEELRRLVQEGIDTAGCRQVGTSLCERAGLPQVVMARLVAQALTERGGGRGRCPLAWPGLARPPTPGGADTA